MTTKEIVKALPKNQILRTIVPDWAHPTIPFPFFRNGISCLGFYFYPMKNSETKHQIQAPIVQVITVYPAGHIVGITASPFFMEDKSDANLILGEYPNATLKPLSLAESNSLYEKYYAACDAYLEKKDTESWEHLLLAVKEEGMDKFFALFSNSVANVVRPQSVDKCIASSFLSEHNSREQEKQSQFSVKTRHIIRNVQTFLKNPIFAKESQEVAEIINSCRRNEYTVAVIGEFSRGKTTFLNNLLGLDCLPVGDLPTTAVLTKIYNGTSSSVTFIDRAKKCSKFTLSSENLERFLADDRGNDPDGVLQITTPIKWLGPNKIVFFDTPGAGDIVGKRADITRRAISFCDSSIMAISAQAACSMTEMEFLKENVLLKAVPHCSILITKLDTVPEKERMRVLSFIKEKIKKITPYAEFWIANEMEGIDSASLDAYGISNIQARILKQSSSNDEADRLREQQLVTRIQSVLASAKAEIKLVEDAEKLSDEEKNKVIDKLKYNKDHLELIKQELLAKCESMQYSAERELLSDLDDCEIALLKDCKMSLQKTVNTKEWVENDFPYMVEKAMKPILARLEKKIICSVTSARTELGNAAKEQLSTPNLTVSLPSYESLPIDTDLNFTPENIEKTRWISRCVTVVTLPVAFCILGPLATLVSGGLGLGSEVLLKRKIEEQKQLIGDHIEKNISQMFSEISEHLRQYLAKCFTELISGLTNEAEKAINNAIAKINAATQERKDCPKESLELKEQINNLLENIK